MAVVLEILYFRTLGLQLFRRVEGDIGLSGIQQLLYIFLIDVTALTLTIGPLVTSEADALIELDAQPLERFNDILLGSRYKAVTVSILDTENKVAAMLAGQQIVIQGGTDSTNVQSPRWTWCKTHPNSSF